MTADVDVCNIALGRLGARTTITALGVGTPESLYCGLFYSQAINATLTAFDWKFAQRIIARSADYVSTGDTRVAGGLWQAIYAYPSDCIKVRRVVAAPYVSRNPVPGTDARMQSSDFDTGFDYISGSSNIALQRVIYTDAGAALLFYTGNSNTPDQWEPSFFSAVTWRIAAELAMPLTAKIELQQAMFSGFAQEIARAAATSADQGVTASDKFTGAAQQMAAPQQPEQERTDR